MPEYGITSEDELFEKDTGEMIDFDEIKKAKLEKIQNDYTQLKKECNFFGKILPIKIIRLNGVRYSCVSVKKDYNFNKMFRSDLKMLYKNQNLSIHALAFIGLFSTFIYFPKNNLIVDSQNPNIEKLCEMMKVKRSKMFEILKELEEKYIIKRSKNGKDLIIYFNPFLFCSGGVIHNDTYELFRYNPYNPEMYANVPAELD
jgi:hypothetical protein